MKEDKESKKAKTKTPESKENTTKTDRPDKDLNGQENIYKVFYEFSPLMYFTVDRGGTTLTVNPTGAEHLGYSRDELIGDSVLKVFFEDDRDKALSRVEVCFNNPGDIYEWELRKEKKDGTVIWVKETAKVIEDEANGDFASILCEDITERKRAELLLATEKNIFELIASDAPVEEILNSLCLDIEAQSEGMLCSFLLLDEKGQKLRHGAAPSLPKNYVKATDGVEIGPSVGSCGTAAYTKKPVIVSDIETDPLWNDYKELALKNGLKSCWSTPIISSDKTVLGTFAVYYNEKRTPSPHERKIIDTAEHLARTALERQRSKELAFRFGEILEESLNEIYIMDADSFKFLLVNKRASANLGYSAEELEQMTPFDLSPELSFEDFKQKIGPLIEGKKKKAHCTSYHRRKDGTVYPMEMFLKKSTFKGKKVLIANLLDTTDLREKEKDLKTNLERVSKKNRYEEIISTITRSVHSSIELQEVLENAVESMNKNIEGVDNVSIYFIQGTDAVIQAWRGYPDWFTKSVQRIPRPKGFTWRVLGEGKQIYCADVEKDNVIGKLGRKVGTKSYASMPIRHGNETIGCININSFKKEAFDSEDLKLLDIIASQIAIAIENARQNEVLRESEERYRTLFYQSPIGVYIFDKNLVITNTNEHHAKTLKNKPENIIGTKLRELNDKTFLGLHEDALKGKSGTQEGYYKATGSPVGLWLHLSIAPLRDGGGDITGGMVVVQDITERKKAEIALSKSQEEYESLVNNVEGIVWKAEPETLAFTFISKQAERILGYPSNSWVEDETLWMSRLHPEDRNWVPSYCRECVDRNQNHTMEYRMYAADGRVVWLRDIVTVVITDGKVTGLRGLMVDITEHKNAENLLKESADRYRALVEKIQDLVVEASSDGKFLYVSPNVKEVLGYDAEELLGLNIFKHVHPGDQEHTFKEFLRIITQQTIGKSIFRFRHNEGNWKWVDATGKTYMTADGEVRCVIVGRDITERKKLEEEIFKKENLESLGVLAGGIAHDFNNLLTSILGNISISKMQLSPKDKMYSRLTEAENASLRAKDLTSQLLTFSRGGAPVKEYVQSLGDLIRDTANFVVSGSKVKCEFDFADKVWPAEIDEGQISQVIHNLILNADQAMPEGGKIDIKLENICHNGSGSLDNGEQRYIKITIQDSGIGMTEELKKKIFDPYFTTKQRGSGLGLTTVYSIIKNHDGHINVQSEIGAGTEFEVLIPAAQYSADYERKEPDLMRGEGKILIMDDEETVREVAGEMVSYLGYEVEYAAHGEEAIEKYVSAMEMDSPYDAVMIDLTIPGGMGGKEANRKLHDIDPYVRTIVSSGYFNDPVMSEYSNYGFKGVITKPYKIEELSRTLHSVLNGSPH